MFFETKIILEREEIQKVIPFAEVVEAFANGMTTSRKRSFEIIFNRIERRKCREFYTDFASWHLKEGVPKKYKVPKDDYPLLLKFCNFATNKGIVVGR